MHPALETFLKEYITMLKATEDECKNTQEKFINIQQKIRTTGVTDELLSNLFVISHNLFQTSYLLMESHMRVNNIRANYSAEDQKIIDTYDAVSNRANTIVRNIITYKQSFEKTDESIIDV